MGWEVEGKFKREEIYVHLWLIYAGSLTKNSKIYKAIILLNKNKLIKKKDYGILSPFYLGVCANAAQMVSSLFTFLPVLFSSWLHGGLSKTQHHHQNPC